MDNYMMRSFRMMNPVLFLLASFQLCSCDSPSSYSPALRSSSFLDSPPTTAPTSSEPVSPQPSDAPILVNFAPEDTIPQPDVVAEGVDYAKSIRVEEKRIDGEIAKAKAKRPILEQQFNNNAHSLQKADSLYQSTHAERDRLINKKEP